MAATIQTQPTQQQTTSLLNNKSVTNPQLKRIVYSKYRELLGSYNDKANAIIDSLPAYMVKEDRGFHFDPQLIDDCENVVYGTPPAPPPLSAGSIPAQRLSTQIPQYNVAEAPACVQNAMMTKDKKPFTYTPGGIDLSQIKSQRMAKRLARNAQSEGTSGQQQLNRPTQQQQSNGGTAPGVAASQLGATAMGMPFQVLPAGPPPPPPQPNKIGGPPLPPPAPQNKLAPQSNGNASRRSPTPQNFEPPPMGFRPEIKIPPNPMASLKKVPPPKEKNNFWVEEYRKERSKSPMVGNSENDNNSSSSSNNPKPETNQFSYSNNNSNQQNDYEPQQNQFTPQSPQPLRQQQQQQEFFNQRQPSPARTPTQQPDQHRPNDCPYKPPYSQQQQQSPSIQRQTSQFQQQNSPQSPTIQRQISQQYKNSPQSPQVQRQQSIPTPPQYLQNSPQNSPSIPRQQTVPQPQYQSPTSPQYQQQQQQLQQQASPTQQQTVPWRQQKHAPLSIQNNVSQPRSVISPAPADSPKPQIQTHQQQQQSQIPAYLRPRETLSPAPEQTSNQFSQPYQQKNVQVGSIYIPPVVNQQQQQAPRQAPTNRWMNAQGQTVETLNNVKPPPQSNPSSNGFGINNNTGLRLQINNNTTSSNVKERIIPIQLEQTPTPTRTPSGFGPQPFYNSAQQQQYSSVPSPPTASNNGKNSPNYVVRSPNQFVDQGYNQYAGDHESPRVTSPPIQQQQTSRIIQQTNTAGGSMTRIIPIAIESQPDGPLNPNNARGPISQQPIVIQNDPRNQNTWGSGSATPTQSKSFRILQKITDTSDDSALENKVIESDIGDQEPQLQRPTFARQMTSTGQINSPNVEQMKRMQLQNDQAYINRARNQGTPPVMKQPQPNKYVTQRPVYSGDEHSQQPYVHPSEQQVPEPKKYTGSAIPSRSFKILQAMTTPENAAENDNSDVVETDTSITECPCQKQQPPPPSYPYPYHYLPPCCAHLVPTTPPPPNPSSSSSSGGDVNNWQYHLPYHPHHHHHHHHHPYSHPHPHQNMHPHQHHPYPFPPPCPCYFYNFHSNDYDSQNCSSRSSFSSRSSLSRGRSQSQDLPNIIITPSTDDVPQEVKTERSRREGSVIDILSQKLNEISKPESKDLNMSQKDDKKFVGDDEKAFTNSPSPNKSECENNKISSEDSSDELSSSSEPTSSLSSDEHVQEVSKEGLQAIKSVTNIQFYNKKMMNGEAEDDDRTIADDESMVFDEEEEEEVEEEEEEEIIEEELEYDEEEVLIEEIDSEEECIEEEEDGEEIIIMDDLSVIYEENEEDHISPRPSSRISSSVSESSTLTNEEEEEKEDMNTFKPENDEEENSNSVTVRLPLRFSFSRSSNDENIGTVEIGSSQIENRSRSFSIASVEAEPESYETDSQDCDVSVTISLSRSSESVDKKALSPSPLAFSTTEVIKEEVKTEDIWESDDDDVSVSFSLPMRNKFVDQTWNGDLTNDISLIGEHNEENYVKEQQEKTSEVEAWRRNNNIYEMNEEKKIQEENILEEGNNNTAVEEEVAQEEKCTNESEGLTKGNAPDEVNLKQIENSDERDDSKSDEELDFWETLQATRREAQIFLEKTAGYWGKSVDGKEKPEPTPNETLKPPQDEENDKDFFSNIRIKNEPEEKKEPKVKTPKSKKKKKIVKPKEPKPEEEPEPKLKIIKLPNANNKSKVVESAIQMIQEKTKKPKKLVKQVSQEEVKVVKAAMENEIIQISKAVEEEKKLIEEAKIRRASLCSAKSIDESKIVEEPVVEKLDKILKFVKEKAELKTQILNKKYAKAFVIPNKPPVMNGVLSEAECLESNPTYNQALAPTKNSFEITSSIKRETSFTETSTSVSTTVEERKGSVPKVLISHELENSTKSNATEEPKKVVKKKLVKTKTVDEDHDPNTLKPPAKKTVPKSTKEPKEPKKIKKKKSVDKAEVSISEEKMEQEVKENKESSLVKTKPTLEEPDFWAEIEISRSKDNLSKVKEEKPIATDPWANIETSPEKESQTTEETVKSKPIDEEPDFWAEIDLTKTKNYQESKPQTLVESSKDKTQQKVLPEQLQTLEWINIELFEAQYVKISEVSTPIVLNGCRDFWEEHLENSKLREEESQDNDFWLEIKSTKVRQEENKEISSKHTPTEDNQSSEEKPKKKVKKSSSASDPGKEAESNKVKTKKKSSSLKDNIDEGLSSKENVREDSTKNTNSSIRKESSCEAVGVSFPEKTETTKKIVKEDSNTELKLKSKKKPKTPEVNGEEKRLSIKSKSKKKLTQTQDDATSSSKSTSSKLCSLPVYSDYDIELVHIDPEPVFYPLHSDPEYGLSFWATVSYVEEDPRPEAKQEPDFWVSSENEGNSEIDTGKIDFWVTQRKFETNSSLTENKTEKVEEQTEEIDFWAEIKGHDDDVNEETNQTDDCELRRNNYKKAMAFFTNTVNVEKKEEPKVDVSEIEPPCLWRPSVEPDWNIPQQCQTDDVLLVVEDNETTEDEPETLIENKPYGYQKSNNYEQHQKEEDESQSSESISDSTPNHFQIEHNYPKPDSEVSKPNENPSEKTSDQASQESKISVKDRIFAFESGSTELPSSTTAAAKTSLVVDNDSSKGNLSRNSSQRSESEIEEDDSGVTDMNKLLSETDTESESFPELRKMSRYQRASTHSRLFKLLQDDGDVIEEEKPGEEALEDELNFKPRKKIVHNVSITRKQNPNALQEAETISQRRQRLSLPLRKNQSIDADNPSSPNSPASPIQGQQSQQISDKLVNELIQSLLLKKSSSSLRNLPMEKLQAAAKRVLEEELDSLENTSVDSTPALTPQEFKNESYADYYDTWSSSKTDSDISKTNDGFEILPSKAFKVLQETTGSAKRKPWAVRCPRVLSSKTVNRDLARVTESPEIISRSSRSPEMFSSERANSVGRWKKT